MELTDLPTHAKAWNYALCDSSLSQDRKNIVAIIFASTLEHYPTRYNHRMVNYIKEWSTFLYYLFLFDLWKSNNSAHSINKKRIKM